jgi:hypothetical protein
MSLRFFTHPNGRSGNLERDWNHFVTSKPPNTSEVNLITINAERLVAVTNWLKCGRNPDQISVGVLFVVFLAISSNWQCSTLKNVMAAYFPICYTSTASVVWWPEFLATDPEVLGSIPDVSRFFEKQWVWNGVHSASWEQLRSYLKGIVADPVYKTEINDRGNPLRW